MTWNLEPDAKQKEAIIKAQTAGKVVRTLGLEIPTFQQHLKRARSDLKKKKLSIPQPNESEVLKACLSLLAMHPKVAFSYRVNSGALKSDKRFIRFGFPGCPDIQGCLRGGRALYIEVKRKGKKPSMEQDEFLRKANAAGAAATWTDDVEKLKIWLDNL